jgi:hypothetical protein
LRAGRVDDEHIDGSERRRDRRDETGDRRFVGHVRWEAAGDAAQLAELDCDALRFAIVQAVDGHSEPISAQSLSHRPSQSTRTAGHQSNTSRHGSRCWQVILLTPGRGIASATIRPHARRQSLSAPASRRLR